MREGRLLFDSDDWKDEGDYEDAMETLTALMDEKNGETYWKATGYGMGWRKREGYKLFEAKDGSELLRAILPNTDNTYKIYNEQRGFIIHNAHHDAPTGETYWVRPISEKTYRTEME
jgi:hypothetical protein